MRVQWTLGDLKSIGGGQIVQIIILRRPVRQLVCVGPGPGTARHQLMHTTLAHTGDHFSFLEALNRVQTEDLCEGIKQSYSSNKRL